MGGIQISIRTSSRRSPSSTFTIPGSATSPCSTSSSFTAPRMGPMSTWYGEISPRLSLGKVLSKLSSKPFKDVLIAATYERGEDADVAEAALAGVGFDLEVGKSGLRYLQLNVYGRSELTEGMRNGFRDVQGRRRSRRATLGGGRGPISRGWLFRLGARTRIGGVGLSPPNPQVSRLTWRTYQSVRPTSCRGC